MTDAPRHLDRLHTVLDRCGSRVVACSGGVDSLLLATVAHRRDPGATIIAHTVTPAVPGEGTARVLAAGRREGWRVELVRSREFDDERYLSNPTDRCYFCKTNLYDAIGELAVGDLAAAIAGRVAGRVAGAVTVLSGANLDDLAEYRPGLRAAAEHGVRHPYVEAQIDKAGIRAIARRLGLAEAELPSSPCLASRLYTGTRVTPDRLGAIEVGEAILREAGAPVARCRLRGDDVTIEVPDDDRHVVTEALVADVAAAMRTAHRSIASVALDDRPYRAGRAILHVRAGT